MTAKNLTCENIRFPCLVMRVVVCTTRFSFHRSFKKVFVNYLWYGSFNHCITEHIVPEILLIAEYTGEAALAK